MKKLLRVCSLFFMSASLCSLTSCDSDYDLSKKIDGEITLGGNGIAFPLGTTENIKVEKLLKISDEKSLITTENGDYYITHKNEASPSAFSVPKFAISSISPLAESLEFGERNPETNSINFSVPGLINFINDSEIPQGVVSLTDATFNANKDGKYPAFKVSIKLSGFPVNMNSVFISNLTLDLPETLTYVPDNEIKGTKLIASGNVALKNGSGEFIKILNVTGSKYTKNATITTGTNNIKTLHTEEKLKLTGTMTVTSALGVNTNIHGESSIIFSGGDVKSIIGVTDASIAPIEYTYTTEFPEFMTEQGSYIDLLNASILLKATNDSPIAIIANAQISSYKNNTLVNNSTIDLDLNIKPTSIDGKTMNTNFWVSNTKEKTPESYIWIDRNISALLSDVPEKVKITITPKITKEVSTIEVGKNYQVKLDYELLIPLMLGEKLTINYNEDFTNLQKDLADIIGKVSELILDVETDNHVPLGLLITPTPIDSKGNILKGVEIKIDGDIKSAEKDINNKTTGTKGVKSNAKLLVKETSKGALKELNTIRINIKANSNKQIEGVMLNKNQFLTILMKATIPNGITVNVNE